MISLGCLHVCHGVLQVICVGLRGRTAVAAARRKGPCNREAHDGYPCEAQFEGIFHFLLLFAKWLDRVSRVLRSRTLGKQIRRDERLKSCLPGIELYYYCQQVS